MDIFLRFDCYFVVPKVEKILDMQKLIILLAALASSPSWAFVLVPVVDTVPAIKTMLRAGPPPMALAEKWEQCELQYNRILDQVHDLMEKEELIHGSLDVAEKMVENALASARRLKAQNEAMAMRAKELHEMAHEDRERAEADSKRAHNEAVVAEWELQMLESMDAAYEDLERLRELSRAHAAHHQEEDSHETAIEDAFVELETEEAFNKFEDIVMSLEDYEKKFKDTLKNVATIRRDQKWKSFKP